MDHPHVCISKEGECVIVTTLIMWGYKSDNDSAAELITGNNSNANGKPLHAYISVAFWIIFKHFLKPTPSILSQMYCCFLLLVKWMMEMLLFHLVNSIRGQEEDKSRLNKQRKQCSHNFWLEQGQKNTRIAETGNTMGETFLWGWQYLFFKCPTIFLLLFNSCSANILYWDYQQEYWKRFRGTPKCTIQNSQFLILSDRFLQNSIEIKVMPKSITIGISY